MTLSKQAVSRVFTGFHFVPGEEGIEPPLTVLETAALPLYYSPTYPIVFTTEDILPKIIHRVKSFYIILDDLILDLSLMVSKISHHLCRQRQAFMVGRYIFIMNPFCYRQFFLIKNYIASIFSQIAIIS